MRRTSYVWWCLLVGYFLLSWVQVLEAAGDTPQAKPAAPAASQETPVMQILEPIFDFGESLEGAEVVHDFKIKNTGKGELKVDQVRPSCGCTIASFDRSIPPGKEGKVTLKVNLRGFQGAFKKTATVFSNDPQNARGLLTIQGNIKAIIEVRPTLNIAFRGMADQQSEKTVEFVGTSKPFKVTKVESNLEEKVRYQLETVQEGKFYRLKIANLLKQGSYNGFVKCLTDVPEKPEISIRVSGFLEGEISVKPLTLLIGKFSAQQPIRNAKVMVVSNRKKPFQIKKLSYDEKLIRVTQEPLLQEPGFRLEVSPVAENLPAAPEGRNQTVLTIETDIAADEPQQVQIHILNTAPAKKAPGAQAEPEDNESEEDTPE